MVESKNEFLKRKKSEKRLQAERQVIYAYNNAREFDNQKHVIYNGVARPWRIQMEPEIEDLYSTIDISKALGMPRERLRDWMVRGFIIPSLPSVSKGTIAVFIRVDVLCVALFQRLINFGLKRETAAEYIDMLTNAWMIPLIRFIALRHAVIDGETKNELDLHMGDGSMNLTIDSVGNIESGPFSPMNCNEWEGIHIINMINIATEVDNALARL